MKLNTFLKLVRTRVDYNADAKEAFHRASVHWLRKLAKALGYGRDDFDLRHCKGGIAVSGEVILHSDTLYIQFYLPSLGGPVRFLWRTVKNCRDYVGGTNQWAAYEDLADLNKLAARMKAAIGR